MMPLFPGLVMGIETSCDETAVAILDGSRVLTSVISSQIELHKQWGGVVPEAAARAHVEAMLPVIHEALQSVNATLSDIAAIAVTNRPGLIGALSVGVTTAKSLARLLKIPLIAVHHLEGHLVSPFLNEDRFSELPNLTLIASGGHTELVLVEAIGNYRLVAETVDDAAGEAFDKSARLLGFDYPGGRAIQTAAQSGNPKAHAFPRSLPQDETKFSFSGLKTAVRREVESASTVHIPDVAASLQQAIVDALVKKTLMNVDIHGARSVSLVGGVAANALLRETLKTECNRRGIEFWCPSLEYCMDNAAMIALAGSNRLAKGERSTAEVDCYANAPLP